MSAVAGSPAWAQQDDAATAYTSLAQEQAQPSDGAANQLTGQNPSSQSQQSSGTSNDRLFFTLPNFLTLENAGKVPPLTTGQKFKAVARGSFDPIELVYFAALAGIGQARNDDPTFGQGAAGYGRRYAATFADETIENFMVGAAIPSLIRQDPRYFQQGHGGFLHRTYYALTRAVITRGDSGHEQFNYSEVIGSAASVGISSTYYPPSDRTIGSLTGLWGEEVALDMLSFEVKEFWPDIRRALHKRKPVDPPPASPTPSQS